MVDPLVAAAAVVLEPPPVSLLGGAGRTNSALTALFAGHSSTTRCSPSPSGTTAFGPGTATARRAIEAATAGTRPAARKSRPGVLLEWPQPALASPVVELAVGETSLFGPIGQIRGNRGHVIHNYPPIPTVQGSLPNLGLQFPAPPWLSM